MNSVSSFVRPITPPSTLNGHSSSVQKSTDQKKQVNQNNESSECSWTFLLCSGTFAVGYCVLGACIFILLERAPEIERLSDLHHSVSKRRSEFLENFLQLKNYDFSNGFEEKWNETLFAFNAYEKTINSIHEGQEYALDKFLGPQRPLSLWESFIQAYIFTFTLNATIGYGNIAPRTIAGRIFCVFYGLIGIPAMLIFIASSGKVLARVLISAYNRVTAGHAHKNTSAMEKMYLRLRNSSHMNKVLGTTLSVFVIIFVLLLYMAVGGVLFDLTEDWGFWSSFYFCFITFTTVGLGDMIPGVEEISVFIWMRGFYVLWGLALTSASIELVRRLFAEVWYFQREEDDSGLRQQVILTQGSQTDQLEMDNEKNEKEREKRSST